MPVFPLFQGFPWRYLASFFPVHVRPCSSVAKNFFNANSLPTGGFLNFPPKLEQYFYTWNICCIPLLYFGTIFASFWNLRYSLEIFFIS